MQEWNLRDVMCLQDLNSRAFSTLGLKVTACVLFLCTVVYRHVYTAIFVSTTSIYCRQFYCLSAA